MSNYRYSDEHLYRAKLTIIHQLRRYYSACYNNKNYITAVEKNISEKLLPQLEIMFMDDIMRGGSHTVKYTTDKIDKSNRFLQLDDWICCGYQIAGKSKIFMEHQGIPLEGDFNLNDEGKKLLQMIDDLKSMDAYQFQKKYYIPPKWNGLEKLLDAIGATLRFHSPDIFVVPEDEFLCTVWDEKGLRFDGTLDDRVKLALLQFFNANQNEYGIHNPSYENQNLYFNELPVEKIKAILIFRRADTSQPFYASALDLTLDMGDGTGYNTKFDINPEQGKAFGEKLTYEVFVPKYGVTAPSGGGKPHRTDYERS